MIYNSSHLKAQLTLENNIDFNHNSHSTSFKPDEEKCVELKIDKENYDF